MCHVIITVILSALSLALIESHWTNLRIILIAYKYDGCNFWPHIQYGKLLIIADQRGEVRSSLINYANLLIHNGMRQSQVKCECVGLE